MAETTRRKRGERLTEVMVTERDGREKWRFPQGLKPDYSVTLTRP